MFSLPAGAGASMSVLLPHNGQVITVSNVSLEYANGSNLNGAKTRKLLLVKTFDLNLFYCLF
jgi:hypothetical protein